MGRNFFTITLFNTVIIKVTSNYWESSLSPVHETPVIRAFILRYKQVTPLSSVLLLSLDFFQLTGET